MIRIDQQNMSPAAWSDLLDEIHDRYFDLTKVKYDDSKNEFHLYFGENRKGPYDERELRISGVTHLEVRDEGQIQFYELFDIEMDSKTQVLKLTADALEMELHVQEGWEIRVV